MISDLWTTESSNHIPDKKIKWIMNFYVFKSIKVKAVQQSVKDFVSENKG